MFASPVDPFLERLLASGPGEHRAIGRSGEDGLSFRRIGVSQTVLGIEKFGAQSGVRESMEMTRLGRLLTRPLKLRPILVATAYKQHVAAPNALS